MSNYPYNQQYLFCTQENVKQGFKNEEQHTRKTDTSEHTGYSLSTETVEKEKVNFIQHRSVQ